MARNESSVAVPRRLKLLMTPFLTSFSSETNSGVKKVCYLTWNHLIFQLGTQLGSFFDQVVVPIFQEILKRWPEFDDDIHVSSFQTLGF